jgi:transposase-like protein
MAVEMVMTAKKGMSAVQVQRHLGIKSYQTAWHMVHRIREAMDMKGQSPMTGIVEIDETYVGGRTKRRFNRASETKAPKDVVVAMRERTSKSRKTTGRVRYFHVKDAKASSIGPILEANLADNVARIYTDNAAVYDFAMNETLSKKHRSVNHSIQWVVPGSRIHTNTVESSFSLLKRGLIGSFHRVSTKHLQRYLNEFEYRFNERNSTQQFENCVAEMCATKPLTGFEAGSSFLGGMILPVDFFLPSFESACFFGGIFSMLPITRLNSSSSTGIQTSQAINEFLFDAYAPN